MGKIRQKLLDIKERLSDRHMYSIAIIIVCVLVLMGVYIYKKQTDYRQAMENEYNMAFFELVDGMQSVETLLAKSLISNSPESSSETLMEIWKDANLSHVYLSQIPINNNEISKASKFLNQVSDYTYSLSRQTIRGESLSQEQLDNLEMLYEYSKELEITLNQLSTDLTNGRIKWGELTKKGGFAFAQQVSNMSKDSFANIEQNLEEYAGLIYDGAFSEHMTSAEKKGLTGEEIDENTATQKAKEFLKNYEIENIKCTGSSDGDIPSYNFEVTIKNNKNKMYIDITKKGGHVIFMDLNKDVKEEKISQEQANNIGLEFLKERGYPQMKETYFLNEGGILTINYAYIQDDVVIYSDLVKLKIALDDGQIVGLEERGYLNSHHERTIPEAKISMEQAKEKINKNLEILSEGRAIIPTEWKTEVYCYEFKGKVKDREFLVYINAETGKEENILMIINTPNGTLTM